ncbi:hypothetical protein ACVRXQ_05190 [Streptococcus panodentis]|uniref:Signal peptide containing protein n=1 Tax=Streptococcus panodentis TaxID=1581472 RepID=A0ABS5AWA5_9STRE|nr:hypothetical protein [Streptococcus panodentis]MBP2620862.1 hypothetical protein [Streptococcus panodentis]
MLKEQRNKGMVALVIVAALFLIPAVIFGYMLYSEANPKTAYAGDSTKTSDETVYVDVYNISEQPVIDVDDNTEVWLIQYKDGYSALQAKKNDSQVADIVQKAQKGELADKPVRVIGQYISSNSKTKDRISNYSSLIRSVGAEFDGVSNYLATDTYVSISRYQASSFEHTWMLLFMVGISILFIILGIIGRRKNIQAYDEIYAVYPEAKDNLNILLENASYHDEVLKIIIYKHHLISYYNGFKAVDLNDVVHLYHHIITMRRSFVVSNRNSTLIAIRSNNKKYQMPIKNIGKTTDTKLQSTFDYLYNHFPHIRLGF